MGKLNETSKIVSKTGDNGEIDFETVKPEVAQKLNGTEVTDNKGNKVRIKDIGKTVNEELEQGDSVNLAKGLGKSVLSALRNHGDDVAIATLRNISQEGCTVHIQYKPDDQGEVYEDDFKFKFENGSVTLNGQEICPLTQLSGVANVQKDLVKDAITNLINSKRNPQNPASTEQVPSGQPIQEREIDTEEEERMSNDRSYYNYLQGAYDELDEKLILGFKGAVENYRKDPKNKESIKELFRQARNFQGDTIGQKLRNAVNVFKSQESQVPDGLSTVVASEEIPDEEPVNSPSDERGCSCDINMDMSLFIRLLEYAKEEAKEDVDLHFVAENVQDVCKSKGCATMRDYDLIISAQSEEGDRKSDAIKPEEVDESWFDPSEDEIEDMRNSAYEDLDKDDIEEGYLDLATMGRVDPDYDTYLAFCEENDLNPKLSSSREEYEFAKKNGDLDF